MSPNPSEKKNQNWIIRIEFEEKRGVELNKAYPCTKYGEKIMRIIGKKCTSEKDEILIHVSTKTVYHRAGSIKELEKMWIF